MQDQHNVTLSIAGGRLRPWRAEDAPGYVAARDEVVFRFTTERRDLTVADTEEAIRRVNASDDVISWAIVDEDGRQVLGNITLVVVDAARCAEAMYFLAPQGRGRGLATAALRAVRAWAFAQLALTRIELFTMPDNVRSQRVAERAAFVRLARKQGVDEEHVYYALHAAP